MNPAYACADIVIGGCRDRASVQDHNGRIMGRSGPVKPALKQFVLDRGAVGLGGAAAEVLNKEAGHSAIIPAEK